jgi:hypothetical protein
LHVIYVQNSKLYINNVQTKKMNNVVEIADLEYELLNKVVEAIHREAGLRLTVKERELKIRDYEVDAIIEIGGYDQPFVAEIKKWAPQANLGALVNKVKNLPGDGLLVADYVNPQMAEKLKEQEVQFIDAAGNAYINRPPLYVFVKGNREIKIVLPTKDGGQRAFDRTGLKIIFAFLCNPKLVAEPYRAIADTADVALGTVGWVLNGLKAKGLVMDRGEKNGRRLVNYRKLLERWVEVYPEKLRPKQKVGEFIANNINWWKEINIEYYDAYWGGEIAAAKYTKYLKPEVATLYLPEEVEKKLFQVARLKKATELPYGDQGLVKVYRPFWKKPENYDGLVHPILAYADLIATGDPRNLETAKIIYDEYIAKYCWEN